MIFIMFSKMKKFLLFQILIQLLLFSHLALATDNVVLQTTNEWNSCLFSSFQDTPASIQSAQTETIKSIVNRGKLRVAMYSRDSWPFYFIDEDKELKGIDVSLIKGFAKLLGVDVEFDRSAKFLDDVSTKVKNHEVDVGISKLSLTFDRAMNVAVTEPYIDLNQALLINRLLLAKQVQNQDSEHAIKNLHGTLGVLKKSSYVGYSKYFKNMELVEYDAWDDALKDVTDGKITAVFRDEAEIKIFLHKNPENALKLMSVEIQDAFDPKGAVVSFDNPQLKDLLNFYFSMLHLKLTPEKAISNYDLTIAEIENKINQRLHK
jgi:polar amino acid transport system substrate-binding protein